MEIDINSFGEKYNLEFETVQVGDRRVRLAVANGEPPFEDSQDTLASPETDYCAHWIAANGR